MPVREKTLDKRRLQKLVSYHKTKTKTEKRYEPNEEAARKREYRLKSKEIKRHLSEAERKRIYRSKIKETDSSRKKRHRERQQKCRSLVKRMTETNTPENTQYAEEYKFTHRSTKSRAVNKLRMSLPKSPRMRLAVMKTYIKANKSPTARGLNKNTQETNLLQTAVLNDIKTAVQACKTKRNKDALTAMNVIISSVSGEHISKAKCVKRLSDELDIPLRRISGGKKIRTTILKSDHSCWTVLLRKTRCDSIDEKIKSKCFKYWVSEGISRPTGNKHDIKRQRLGPKLYSSHMIHVLEKSQTEVYTQFKCEHPEIKISQRQFEKYKPYYVRSVREQDRQTCCCRKHVEIGLVFKSCKDYVRKIGGDMDVFDTLSHIVDLTMCNEQHAMCINRTCKDCGVNKLELPQELETSDTEVRWEKYEYVKINNKQKVQTKLMLVKKTTSPEELFRYFKELLTSFPAHRHRAVWQHKQFRSLVENLPQGDCLCLHDFSENYRCSEKQELQTTYFQKTEVTIHVSLLYRHAILEYDGLESTQQSPEIITETIFSISPDQLHDNIFVKEVQHRVADHLREINYGEVKILHEFTDGCAAQYRSRHCFADLQTAYESLDCRGVIRNYFETSHAKGPQDAAGGFLKRQADLSVLRGGAIQNAHDLYEFGCTSLKENKSTSRNTRIFWYIPEIERNPRKDVQPVVGIRNVRQVKAVNGTVKTRDLSCYTCDNCLSDIEPCTNTCITGPFSSVTYTCNTELSDEQVLDYSDESQLLAPGMIIAVLADDPVLDYYLMEVRKPPYIIRKDCSDQWGASFSRGSEVISGNYYDLISDNPLHLKKLKRKQAIVLACAYVYTCADIESASIIQLSEEVHLNILARVQELSGDL